MYYVRLSLFFLTPYTPNTTWYGKDDSRKEQAAVGCVGKDCWLEGVADD